MDLKRFWTSQLFDFLQNLSKKHIWSSSIHILKVTSIPCSNEKGEGVCWFQINKKTTVHLTGNCLWSWLCFKCQRFRYFSIKRWGSVSRNRSPRLLCPGKGYFSVYLVSFVLNQARPRETITRGDSARKNAAPVSNSQLSRPGRQFDLDSNPLEGTSKSFLQQVSSKFSDQD